MKKKAVIHQFDPVIYPIKLWVMSEYNPALIDKLFKNQNGSKLNISRTESSNISTYDRVIVHRKSEKYGILIVLNGSVNISVGSICHEATHASRFIWGHLRELDTGIEADAYLVGWIADCIDKTLKNKL